MRRVRDLRLAGLIAFVAALAVGLFVGLVVHLLLGGRLGWEDFDLPGLVEGFFFLVAFVLSLFAAKRAVRVPCSTLLTAGAVAPWPARRLAEPVPAVATPAEGGGRWAVLVEDGRPVGVLGLGSEIVPWEEAPVVAGEVAITELAPLFWQGEAVFVADGTRVHGVITRERYLRAVVS